MLSNKKIGLLAMVGSPAVLVLYFLGGWYIGRFVIYGTVIVFVSVILGLFTWIGYTMFTEPPPTRATTSELDSLEQETINPTPRSNFSTIVDCSIDTGTEVRDHVNLYKCRIGKNCKVESFVYIEEGVVIGDRCKIKPSAFIPTGVTLEDDVFVGPNATFTNDKYPRTRGEWEIRRTLVGSGASIGAHSVILPGVRIGKKAIVGAGSVVATDVPDSAVVCGNPARILGESTLRPPEQQL